MDQTMPNQPSVQPRVNQEVATLTTQSPPKSSSKKLIIASLVLVLVIGAIAYFILQKPQSETPPIAQQPTSISPTPTEPVISVTNYIGTSTVILSDVSGGSSSGNATRVNDIGKATLTLEATLPDPLEQNFYQAWVVNSGGGSRPLGRLSRENEGTYSLEVKFNFPPSSPPFTEFDELHNTVVVSLESVDDDSIETKLLEGTFTR